MKFCTFISAIFAAVPLMSDMKRRKYVYLIIVLVLVVVVYLFRSPENGTGAEPYRNITEIVYTNHARCRMGCRDISENEIKKVLEDGSLNRAKSGFDRQHNDQTYAVEGYGNDGQFIRVVVTPRNNQLLVITVIDLRKDWACNCP